MKKQTSNRVKSLRDPVAEVGREPADHDLVRVLIPLQVKGRQELRAEHGCLRRSHRRSRRHGRTHPTADLSDPEEKPGIADALVSLPSLFRHFCRNDGKIRRLF